MNGAKATARIIQAAQRAYTKKFSFLAVFLVVLAGTVTVCNATGFIPDSQAVSDLSVSTSTDPFVTVTNSSLMVGPAAGLASASAAATAAASTDASAAPVDGSINMSGDLPVKIVIPSIGVSAPVANPDTLNVDDLDTYLLKGAARYPTSATLGEQGNVIIFGHSSYLPVVINQHFKTFDGIQNLTAGQQIFVYSSTKEYVYSVTSENEENSNSNFAIPLTTTGYTLTLSTCDSFATKSDRFIVTATLVGSYALGSQ